VLDLPVRDLFTATKNFEDLTPFLVPTGIIVRFDGPDVPVGWMPLDGRALLRADYPALSRVYPGSGTAFTIPTISGWIIKL